MAMRNQMAWLKVLGHCLMVKSTVCQEILMGDVLMDFTHESKVVDQGNVIPDYGYSVHVLAYLLLSTSREQTIQ